MRKKFAIGIDVGGTNSRVALVKIGKKHKHSAQLVEKKKIPTKRLAGPSQTVNWIARAIAELLDEQGVSREELRGIGVGVPGSVEVERGIVHFLPNVRGWKNVPLAKALEQRTGFETRVDNDANAMAHGEFLFGAAQGAKNAVFVTLGTGVGGGLLVRGKLFHGKDFSAAEIGHVRYRPDGVQCACGARGCIETELGKAYLVRQIEKDLKAGVSTKIRSILAASPDKKIRLEMAEEAANNRDRYALAFWARTGAILGDFLAGLANLFDPDVIVIGGGVAGAGRHLLDPLKKTFKKAAFPAAANAAIVPAHFGNEAGMIGAASLVFAEL